jgi:spermidine/putrescine transport system permease protein
MLGQMRRQLTPEINAISTGLLLITVAMLTAFFLLTRKEN